MDFYYSSCIGQARIRVNKYFFNPALLAITLFYHPGDKLAGFKELDYLIAGDCGIKGEATYIKYVPDIHENHIIKSGKYGIMSPIYPTNNGKNSPQVSNVDNADPIFDRSKIAEEILIFQINARRKAQANRRPVNA